MKRLLLLLCCLALALPVLGTAEEEKVLNLFTWELYVDDQTIADFEAETGIKVVYSTFDTNENMIAKLQLVRLRDRQGCLFTARASLEETLRLRLCCPEQECWRGRIYLQAAARLCGNACPCDGDGCCPARLELCLEGFLLLPCAAMPPAPACPADPRPWYPQFSK